jgi:hypothetical protein
MSQEVDVEMQATEGVPVVKDIKSQELLDKTSEGRKGSEGSEGSKESMF